MLVKAYVYRISMYFALNNIKSNDQRETQHVKRFRHKEPYKRYQR